MNLTQHINEKDMDQLRTEQVQKKKNEFHLYKDRKYEKKSNYTEASDDRSIEAPLLCIGMGWRLQPLRYNKASKTD